MEAEGHSVLLFVGTPLTPGGKAGKSAITLAGLPDLLPTRLSRGEPLAIRQFPKPGTDSCGVFCLASSFLVSCSLPHQAVVAGAPYVAAVCPSLPFPEDLGRAVEVLVCSAYNLSRCCAYTSVHMDWESESLKLPVSLEFYTLSSHAGVP